MNWNLLAVLGVAPLARCHCQFETAAQELQELVRGPESKLHARINLFDPALKEAIGWTAIVTKSKYERESHTGNNLSKSIARIQGGSILLELR